MNYTQYGFEYTGSCNCDGVQTEKYKNGEWQLRHRPKHGVYKFKKNGRTVSEWVDQVRAEEFLKANLCLEVRN